MIPPKGFRAELYPLRHKFIYSFGLSSLTSAADATMMTFVKNYKGVGVPSTLIVNPHHASFEVETGAICAPMSIIDRIEISMHFTLTEDAIADGMESAVVQYMPIFTSFEGRLDSVDNETSLTGAAILELTKDATQEDITPAFSTTNLNTSAGVADLVHPTSSANFTEVFGTLNLSVNTSMESVPWANSVFYDAMKYYTNKGAIRSMVGKMRTVRLTKDRPTKNVFIRKFPPRDVRRIQPYSFFGMVVSTPLSSFFESPYYSGAITVSKPQIGVKAICTYDEWNIDHNQDMA